jgi:DNA (cytosine-5)-methyltransferase 1
MLERIPILNIEQMSQMQISVCGGTTDKELYFRTIVKILGKSKVSKRLSSSAVRVRERFSHEPLSEINVFGANLIGESYCHENNPKCESCPLKYHCNFYKVMMSASRTSGPIFADIFSGAGGLSLGFEQSGWSPGLVLDNDYWSLSTFLYNRPGIEETCDVVLGDVTEFKLSDNRQVDLVTGGIPCQAFSNANRQRSSEDPRLHLFRPFFGIVSDMNPSLVLVENVSGFKIVESHVNNLLDELGYTHSSFVLLAQDFGVPQNRKRMFILGIKKDMFKSPESTTKLFKEVLFSHRTSEQTTLRDAISDLPLLEASRIRNKTDHENKSSGFAIAPQRAVNSSQYVKKINQNEKSILTFNHKSRYNNDRDIEIFGLLKEGENSLAKSIQHIMPYANRNHIFKDKYYKLRYDEISKTITAHMRWDCNMYIHPSQARGLTSREAARVQSFPDDYVFTGTFQRLYQQIGNAVPPLLARAIGDALMQVVKP